MSSNNSSKEALLDADADADVEQQQQQQQQQQQHRHHHHHHHHHHHSKKKHKRQPSRVRPRRLCTCQVVVGIIGGFLAITTCGVFVYTGFALAHLAKWCVSMRVGLSVAGAVLVVLLSAWTIWAVRRRKRYRMELRRAATSSSSRGADGAAGGGGVGASVATRARKSGEYHRLQHPGSMMEDEEDEEVEHVSRSGRGRHGINGDPVAVVTKRSCGESLCFYWWVFFSLVVFVLVWVSFGFVAYLQLNTLPKVEGELSLPGLTSTVTVEREQSGMIHILADNDHDMYFAQGVVQSQERLWQMEFQRRVASGTLSAVVGDGALKIDKLTRTLGIRSVAEENIKHLSSETLDVLKAYCEGVNAYIESSPPLPFEFVLLGFKPKADWSPADLIGWAKMMSLQLSLNMNMELQRFDFVTKQGLSHDTIAELIPSYDIERFPTVLSNSDVAHIIHNDTAEDERDVATKHEEPIFDWFRNAKPTAPRTTEESFAELFEAFTAGLAQFGGSPTPGYARASNNWVVHGNRTESGKPFLCNDPHLDLMAPSIWLLMHLHSPHSDVIGATFLGLPSVVLGRNNHIAWGVTNVGADVQDLYIMDGNETHYRHNGNWHAYIVRSETIHVKHGDDVVVNVRESLYGPVINHNVGNDVYDGSVPLSLKWTSLADADPTIESFLAINRARNYDEFRSAQRQFIVPLSNMIYADREGHIAYTMPGLVPTRHKAHSGLYPVPGNGSFDWTGFVPFDKMPTVLDPEEGFIASANNQVTPSEWPDKYRIALDWDAGSQGYRAMRITEMIKSKTKLSKQDMIDIQLDYTSLAARDFRQVLEQIDTKTLSGKSKAWLKRVLAWDHDSAPHSAEAPVYNLWYAKLAQLGAGVTGRKYWNDPIFIQHLFNVSGTVSPHVSQSVCGSGGCVAKATLLFEEAVQQIAGAEWASDELHFAEFEHQILGKTPLACVACRSVAHGGDQFTVNVGGFSIMDNKMTQHHGPSYREIVDLGDMQKSLFLNPLGQSGNILARGYDDLLEAWSEGTYLDMVTTNYASTKTLKLTK